VSEQSHSASLPHAPQQWSRRTNSVDTAGWPIFQHDPIPVFNSPEISASPEPEQPSSGRHHYLDSFGNPVSFSNPVRSYSANYPPIGENSVDSVEDDPRTATFIPMNSAEPQTSNTVQEGQVVNIAVQYRNSTS
jgi:hypothetical protein